MADITPNDLNSNDVRLKQADASCEPKEASFVPIVPQFRETYPICAYKYWSCQGRASRTELWYWMTWQFLIGLGLGLAIQRWIAFADSSYGQSFGRENCLVGFVYLLIVALTYLVFAFLPTYSVFIRRCHDWGASAWIVVPFFFGVGYFLFEFRDLIPIWWSFAILAVLYIVLGSIPPTQGANKFGAQPIKREEKEPTTTESGAA